MARQGLTKDKIVWSAAELADEIGLRRLTFNGIADTLGVKTPSLYNHIDGLEGLRRELSLYGLIELNKELQQAAIGKARDEAIAAMLHAYRAFAKARPGVYEATLQAPEGTAVELQAASEAIIRTVLRVLEAYQLKDEEAIHVVRGFRAIAHGFSSLESIGGFGLALNTDDSFQKLVADYLRGLSGSRDGAQ